MGLAQAWPWWLVGVVGVTIIVYLVVRAEHRAQPKQHSSCLDSRRTQHTRRVLVKHNDSVTRQVKR